MDDGDNWIPITLQRVILRDKCDQQWIYLQEQDGTRGFPSLIATHEALEIHRVATCMQTQRPLTHALTHETIRALGGNLERVDIDDVAKGTFYAKLVLKNSAGELTAVDARPSDALAIGLRQGCPFRVRESVLQEVRTDKSGPDPMPGEDPLGEAPS